MIPRMTDADEQRLFDAFDGMQARVSSGDTPNEAAIKVARDLELPLGHVPILARVYNTHAGNEARRAGDSLLAKAAAIAVADPDEILRELRAGMPATKAAAARDDFASPPDWYRAEPADAPAMTKVAFPLLEATANDLAYREEFEPHRELAGRYAPLGRARDKAADAFDAAMVAEERLLAGLSKMAGVLGDDRGPSLADVRPNVAAVMGADAVSVLDHIERRHPALAKQASRYPYHPVEPGRGVYGLLATVVDLARDAAKAAADNAAAAEAYKVAEAQALPRIDRRAPGTESHDLLAKAAAGPFATSLGVALSRDAVQGAMDRLGVPAQDKRVDRAYSTLTNPSHEQELEDIHTRAMLADLMANDEVIAGHDPHEVASSFNNISRLAPRVSRQPLLMETLLRQSLQQGTLGHYDGDQILSTEQKLRDTSGTHPFLAKPNKGVSNGPKPLG